MLPMLNPWAFNWYMGQILKIVIHLFFNFEHQLLHIFQWDVQNHDIPHDQLEEESHNIWSNFAIVSCMSVNLSIYFSYSWAHKVILMSPRIQKIDRQIDRHIANLWKNETYIMTLLFKLIIGNVLVLTIPLKNME